ncbi:MAG: YkgJ family cysteine cluster protein [Rhodospirillales bacterium]|nr:YkgJ family cysteine cluster protein [Rhodospirillales bacterium]MDP6772859.1 YkgJ family cysteine cluster protein [Rhodospirillales bacterium]
MAEIVVRTLKAFDSAQRLNKLFDAAAGFVGGLMADLERTQPPPRPIACGEGCAYCCTGIEVHVSAFEVLRIADHVSRNLTRSDLADLVKTTKAVDAKKNSAREAGAEHPRFTCPLLVDNRCLVYDVRPFICRGFNSYDALKCEQRKRDGIESVVIEGYVHPKKVAKSALNGVRLGCIAAGLEDDVLDLAPALLIALTNPDSRERWLGGEAVFETARVRLGFEDAD